MTLSPAKSKMPSAPETDTSSSGGWQMNLETYFELFYRAKLAELHEQQLDDYFADNDIPVSIACHFIQIRGCQKMWTDAVKNDLLTRHEGDANFKEYFEGMMLLEEENAKQDFDAWLQENREHHNTIATREGIAIQQQINGDEQSRDGNDPPSPLVYSPGSSMDSHHTPTESEDDSTISSAFGASPTMLDGQPEARSINDEDDEMEPGMIQRTESDEEESESEPEQRKSTRLQENVSKNSNMQSYLGMDGGQKVARQRKGKPAKKTPEHTEADRDNKEAAAFDEDPSISGTQDQTDDVESMEDNDQSDTEGHLGSIRELLAGERHTLEITTARFASNNNFAGADTKIHQIVAYLIQCILNDDNRSPRDANSIVCHFFRSIQGNFDLEELIAEVNDVESAGVQGAVMTGVKGEMSIFTLCAKLEKSLKPVKEIKELSRAVSLRWDTLKREIVHLYGEKAMNEPQQTYKVILYYLRGDNGDARQRLGTNYMLNLSFVQICFHVMHRVVIRAIFDGEGPIQDARMLYEKVLPSKQFKPDRVSVLEMERVIDIAFDSDDEQLRKDAVKVFESIKTSMRSDKIFRLGCKVQYGIDGRQIGNSATDYCIGSKAEKRRKRIINIGTTLFLLKFLRRELPSVHHNRFVCGVLLSTQRVIEKELSSLFDKEDFTLLPAARAMFTKMLLNEGTGKTLVFEQSEQLDAYRYLVEAC